MLTLAMSISPVKAFNTKSVNTQSVKVYINKNAIIPSIGRI
jgi:hypothetical protein